MHRVVLSRPAYSSNVGLCCRVMKNFGFGELAIVGSSKKTATAFMYAKHSKEVLQGAKECRTLEEAVKGCDLVVGTTGAPDRFHKNLKTCIPLEALEGKLRGKVAFVFGSEGVGLNAEEVDACDLLVHIPSNPAHPVLNLSHSVAVVLYAVSRMPWLPRPPALAAREKKALLEKKFGGIVSRLDGIKNKGKVSVALHRLLGRSEPTEDEVQALLAAFSCVDGELKRR